MSALSLTEANLKKAVAEEYADGERAKAQRAVSRFNIKDVPVEQQVQVACAIRRLLGNDIRLTQKLLDQWVRKVVYAAKLTRKFWVVPKPRDMGAIPAVAVIDPASLDIPQGIDVSTVFIVDQMMPREVLGPGVLELELSAKESWTDPSSRAEPSHSSSSPAAITNTPGQEDQTTHTAPAAAGTGAASAPTAKRARMLDREPSDEQKLDQSLEDMAVKAREAFTASRFYSEDSGDHMHGICLGCMQHAGCPEVSCVALVGTLSELWC